VSWLKGTASDKYRQDLVQAMMLAQNRYERRKLMAGGVEKREEARLVKLQKDYEFIKNGKFKQEFDSNNKQSISETQMRQLLKRSSCMKNQLERYFEINDEEKFAYYDKNKIARPRKELDTNKV
jgi:hypothetical protein